MTELFREVTPEAQALEYEYLLGLYAAKLYERSFNYEQLTFRSIDGSFDLQDNSRG